MTLLQILSVVRARWRFAFFILALVVAVVAGVSLMLPPKYTATASVVLDVKSPDPIAGVVLPGMTVVGYMGTQLGVMQSDRVALGALQALHLDQDPELQRQWREQTGGQGEFRAWLAEWTLRRLDVTPGRDANIITVAFTSPDPKLAATMANAIVKAYIDTTLVLRVEPAKQYNSFFDDNAKQMRAALEQAQAKLSAYQQSKGIVATDEKLDIENLRLAELSSQLVVLQGLANESSGRQSQSDSSPERMPEVLSNPIVIGLTTELSRQEGQLNDLTSRLGDNNPQVIEMRSHVAQLRARIGGETKRIAGSLTVNNNVNQTRLAQVRGAVDEQRSKLLRLKGQRDESSVLQRDVENAQRAYDMVLTRATQSGVESQATQTNVSVLKQATPPPLPSSPKLLLNIVASVLIGGMLAVAGAMLREARDRRLRNDADVLRVLRQPLLGVLPHMSRAKVGGRSRLRLTTNEMGGWKRRLSQ